MPEKQTAKLVEFGNGGDLVYYSRHSTGSGYGSPELPHAAELGRHDIPEGCPAVDLRPALATAEGLRWAFQGPMVDVELEPGQVDACPDPSPILAAGVSGAFRTYLELNALHRASSGNPGPLDSVDVVTYLEGWRARGARVGRVQGGRYVFE